MLKKRLIACLPLMDGQVVQSINFQRFNMIGNAAIVMKHLNAWEVDEIVFLDINRRKNYDFWRPDVNYDNTLKEFADVIRYVSTSMFVPLTAGGGIRNVDDMRRYIHAGADKISVNTAAIENPKCITEGATIFGSQCIVVSIDAKRQSDGSHHVMASFGQTDTGMDVVAWAKRAEELGAGEIFLTSIDQDGSMKGYDVPLIQSVVAAVHIPVIASGGVGDWKHLLDGIAVGASAVSVANKFHFTEHSIIEAKKFLRQHDIDVR